MGLFFGYWLPAFFVFCSCLLRLSFAFTTVLSEQEAKQTRRNPVYKPGQGSSFARLPAYGAGWYYWVQFGAARILLRNGGVTVCKGLVQLLEAN